MFSVVYGHRSEFDGPIQAIFWPLAGRLASVNQYQCRTYALFDDDREHTPEETKIAVEAILSVTDNNILAIGPTAAAALLGNQWTSMPVNSGMTYVLPTWHNVTVCWNVSAALAGGNDGKDPLAWVGDALTHWRQPRFATPLTIPDWVEYSPGVLGGYASVGIDTEGTPEDPLCMTVASPGLRVFVDAVDVVKAWRELEGKRHVYHNAPWDWRVLESMGVYEPWKQQYVDTMEKAYIRQTEPQGLKDLGKRHFGVDMVSWEDTVMPRYGELVQAMADGVISAGTKTTTHSPKTGKLYKKPKVEYSPEAKRLVKLKDPLKIAEALKFEKPTLRHVPYEEFVEYATLDPYVTYYLRGVL